MTEHLPECFASLCECDDTHFKSTDCDFNCICPSLRACEQRIEEEMDYAWQQTVDIAVAHTRVSTLNAVRDAVLKTQDVAASGEGLVIRVTLGAGIGHVYVNRDAVVAAIDALREEKP